MCDINKRAVHLCKINADLNEVDVDVFISDIYENVEDKYDLIITNPPIRAGKEVLINFIKGGLARLNKDGEIWFVISKDKGAKSLKKELEKDYTCHLVGRSKGFWVIRAKN